MIKTNKKSIEYMCTWCGIKVIRKQGTGRPLPGECPRKPKSSNAKTRPHTWVINKYV